MIRWDWHLWPDEYFTRFFGATENPLDLTEGDFVIAVNRSSPSERHAGRYRLMGGFGDPRPTLVTGSRDIDLPNSVKDYDFYRLPASAESVTPAAPRSTLAMANQSIPGTINFKGVWPVEDLRIVNKQPIPALYRGQPAEIWVYHLGEDNRLHVAWYVPDDQTWQAPLNNVGRAGDRLTPLILNQRLDANYLIVLGKSEDQQIITKKDQSNNPSAPPAPAAPEVRYSNGVLVNWNVVEYVPGSNGQKLRYIASERIFATLNPEGYYDFIEDKPPTPAAPEKGSWLSRYLGVRTQGGGQLIGDEVPLGLRIDGKFLKTAKPVADLSLEVRLISLTVMGSILRYLGASKNASFYLIDIPEENKEKAAHAFRYRPWYWFGGSRIVLDNQEIKTLVDVNQNGTPREKEAARWLLDLRVHHELAHSSGFTRDQKSQASRIVAIAVAALSMLVLGLTYSFWQTPPALWIPLAVSILLTYYGAGIYFMRTQNKDTEEERRIIWGDFNKIKTLIENNPSLDSDVRKLLENHQELEHFLKYFDDLAYGVTDPTYDISAVVESYVKIAEQALLSSQSIRTSPTADPDPRNHLEQAMDAMDSLDDVASSVANSPIPQTYLNHVVEWIEKTPEDEDLAPRTSPVAIGDDSVQGAAARLKGEDLLKSADPRFHSKLTPPEEQYKLIPGLSGLMVVELAPDLERSDLSKKAQSLFTFTPIGENGSLARQLFEKNILSVIHQRTVDHLRQTHGNYPSFVVSNHPALLKARIPMVEVFHNGRQILVVNSAWLDEMIKAAGSELGNIMTAEQVAKTEEQRDDLNQKIDGLRTELGKDKDKLRRSSQIEDENGNSRIPRNNGLLSVEDRNTIHERMKIAEETIQGLDVKAREFDERLTLAADAEAASFLVGERLAHALSHAFSVPETDWRSDEHSVLRDEFDRYRKTMFNSDGVLSPYGLAVTVFLRRHNLASVRSGWLFSPYFGTFVSLWKTADVGAKGIREKMALFSQLLMSEVVERLNIPLGVRTSPTAPVSKLQMAYREIPGAIHYDQVKFVHIINPKPIPALVSGKPAEAWIYYHSGSGLLKIAAYDPSSGLWHTPSLDIGVLGGHLTPEILNHRLEAVRYLKVVGTSPDQDLSQDDIKSTSSTTAAPATGNRGPKMTMRTIISMVLVVVGMAVVFGGHPALAEHVGTVTDALVGQTATGFNPVSAFVNAAFYLAFTIFIGWYMAIRQRRQEAERLIPAIQGLNSDLSLHERIAKYNPGTLVEGLLNKFSRKDDPAQAAAQRAAAELEETSA
jgi:hypothetical protein